MPSRNDKPRPSASSSIIVSVDQMETHQVQVALPMQCPHCGVDFRRCAGFDADTWTHNLRIVFWTSEELLCRLVPPSRRHSHQGDEGWVSDYTRPGENDPADAKKSDKVSGYRCNACGEMLVDLENPPVDTWGTSVEQAVDSLTSVETRDILKRIVMSNCYVDLMDQWHDPKKLPNKLVDALGNRVRAALDKAFAEKPFTEDDE